MPRTSQFNTALGFMILTLNPYCAAQSWETAEELDPLTIYADKLHKEWLDTEGSSISYASSYLLDSGINSEHDFIAKAGGFLGNPTAGQLSLRGLNNDNIVGYLGTRSNSIISALVNGVPISASTSRYFPQSIWGVQSASVLQGGQSSTYGPNALGGIIRYEYARPEMDSSGGLRAEFGTRNTLRVAMHQNLKLSENSALRLSYERIASDGAVENTTLNNKEWELTDRDIYGLQFLWRSPDQATEVHATLKYDHSNSNPFGGVRAFGPYSDSDRKTDENTRTFYPADHWLGTINFKHETEGGLTFTNAFGISSLNVDALIDLDGTALLPWFTGALIDEFHASNDFSVRGNLDDHIWLLGTYTQYSTYDVGFKGSGLVGLGIPFESLGEEEVLINALYGKFDYQFNPRWHLIGGLRMNHEKRNLKSFAKIGPSPERRSNEETTYTDLLPSLTLAWSPNEKTTTGLKISRNYRGGGVSYAPSLGLTQSYAPEYSNDIELYIKSSPSETLQWSASIFYNELTDMQVPISQAGGVPNIDVLINNTGKGKKYGVELQTMWEPAESLFLDLTATYLQTEFTSLNINGVDLSGQDFPNAPEFAGSIGIGFLPETGLYGSLRYSYSSSAYSQVSMEDTTGLETRSDLSARIGYKWKNWNAYLFGSNLLNKDYALGRVDSTGIGAGVVSKFNQPRTFGVGFSTSW